MMHISLDPVSDYRLMQQFDITARDPVARRLSR